MKDMNKAKIFCDVLAYVVQGSNRKKTDVLGISLVWFLIIAKKIQTILIVSGK